MALSLEPLARIVNTSSGSGKPGGFFVAAAAAACAFLNILISASECEGQGVYVWLHSEHIHVFLHPRAPRAPHFSRTFFVFNSFNVFEDLDLAVSELEFSVCVPLARLCDYMHIARK